MSSTAAELTAPREGAAQAFSRFGLLLSMGLCLFSASSLYELLPGGDALRSVAISTVFVLSLLGVASAVVIGEWLAALTSAAMLASIWFYLALFSHQFGTPFAWNAGGMYFGATLAALYVPAMRSAQFPKTVDRLLALVTIYAAAYLVASWAFEHRLLHNQAGSRLVMSADDFIGRKARLSLAAPFVVLALATGLTKFLRRKSFFGIACCCVCGAALWTANSRGILAATALMTATYVLLRSSSTVGRAAWTIFAIGSVASLLVLYGAVDVPSLMSRDISASVRHQSLELARLAVGPYWLLGVGLPNGGLGYAAAVNSKTFFTGDIGMVGIGFGQGLVGFAAYVAVAWTACRAFISFGRLGLSQAIVDGIALTGAILTAYSLQAASFFAGSGAALASLFIAAYLAQPATHAKRSASRDKFPGLSRNMPAHHRTARQGRSAA